MKIELDSPEATAYLIRSIRNDEFGIQKIAYGGAA